uniref:Zinc finger protein 239 n=1 Tax=Rousettus aegyptiacus TaxID=9407 RepID=A0A7J8GJ31_ROUAE|nr:zinc finger protein 239 [Rousettus aegyptiacus]
MASMITGSQDYIVNLQGEVYGNPELDLSPYQKWGELSSHISRNKSSVVTFQNDDFKNIESEDYLSLKFPNHMATQDSSVTFCKNELQDPQEIRSLFVTEESTKRKLTGRKSPPIDHCSENHHIKFTSDVTELVSPLISGEAICQNGQSKESSDPFDCNHKDIYGWKSWVVSHQRAHTEEHPYNCYDCGKIPNTTSDSHLHKKIHTAEKQYQYSRCGKDFSESSELLLHQKDCTEEKPYKCEQCGKGFTRSSSLLIHRAIHTDEKPYKCDKCGKGFTRSSSLLIHHAVHTEIPTKGGKDQKPTKNLEETNHELQLDRTLKKQVENYKDGAGLKKERMDHKIFYFP